MLPGVGGFRVTRVTDKELLTQNQHYAMMHSISAMQENQHKSVEEIRYEAYAKAGEPAPPGTSPGAFGQPTSGGTPFGTSAAGSGFGGGPNPSAGVFGAPASTLTLGGTAGASFVPAASSPFGVANNTAFGGTPGAASPFGASTSSASGAFGASPQGGGAFGAVPAGAGIFSGSSPTGSAFGNPNGASSFGGAATSTFGGSSGGAGNMPFGGSSPSTGAFGGATPANPFGPSSTPAFTGSGVPAPSFGATTPVSSFGGATAAFGAPASTPTFGSSPIGGGSGFGAAAPTSTFGAPATSPTFGIAAAAFGAPAQPSGFGAGASASSTSFGAPVSTPAFGNAPGTPSLNPTSAAANSFGASTAASASAFGASPSAQGGALGFSATTAPAGSFFGSATLAATTSSGSGASPASSSAFGGLSSIPTATPTIFGGIGGQLTTPGPSLTPTVSSAPAFSFAPASSPLSGGGTFGAAAQPAAAPSFGAGAPTSLFGTPAVVSAPATSASLFGVAPVPTGADGGVTLGYGSKTLGLRSGSTGGVSQGEGISTGSPSVNAAPYGNSLTVPPPATSPATVTARPLKKSLLVSASAYTSHVSFPVRTLTPRSPWLTSRGGISPRMKPRGKSVSPSSGEELINVSEVETSRLGRTPIQLATADHWMFKPRENPRKLFIRPEPAVPPPSASLVVLDNTSRSNTVVENSSGSKHRTAAQKTGGSPESRHVHFKDEVAADENVMFIRNTTDNTSHEVTTARKEPSCASLPTLCTRDGYSMEPSLEVLRMLSEEKGEDALADVQDFVVSRQNFGSIRWLEPVDVRGLEIDRVVRIECGVIYVYPESSGVISPPAGEGLKKRAEVTLYECRPKKTGEAARAKFEERVLKQTRRMGGDLLEYNVGTGVWRFALQL